MKDKLCYEINFLYLVWIRKLNKIVIDFKGCQILSTCNYGVFGEKKKGLTIKLKQYKYFKWVIIDV